MKKTVQYILMIIALVGVLSECSSTKDEPKTKGETGKTEENQNKEKIIIQSAKSLVFEAPLATIIENKAISGIDNEVEFSNWKTPDELRARLSSQQLDISAAPSYVGANLYNKGVELQLLNIMVWGNLYFIGPEGEKLDWNHLKGKTVHMPFKGDMPDLVFQFLLKKNNLEIGKDVKVEYMSTPQEIVQFLAMGKAKYAVLPEHTASLSVKKANSSGQKIAKIGSIQEEWAAATGKPARIPQAGFIATKKVIEENPKMIEAFQKELQKTMELLKKDPKKASEMLAVNQEGIDAAFIEKTLPDMNLEFVTASDAKEELEYFFEQLAILSPDIIGGKLPDAGFYYEP